MEANGNSTKTGGAGFGEALRFFHARGLLELLLLDRATRGNIVWATDAYADLGLGFLAKDGISAGVLLGPSPFELLPRAAKTAAAKSSRTKSHAEVFTPLAVCRKMIAALPLPRKNTEAFLDATCLELACGEAPFLVQRHDPATAAPIGVADRGGLLDRKLRAAAELAGGDPAAYPALALRALRSTYAFELQGDSLLIARLSALLAVLETHRAFFPGAPEPDGAFLRDAASAVAWNFFQMDALSGTAPVPPADPGGQTALFSPDNFLPPPPPPKPVQATFGFEDEPDPAPFDPRPPALVADWKTGRSFPLFHSILHPSSTKELPMKFDYVIGNPPYQDEAIGENKTFAPPIYHTFLDGAFQVSTTALLVHPARFLFDAGSTPHEWNRKMLADPHFKVLHYQPVASTFFPMTEIKGGVAITLHDDARDFGPIEIFTPYPELNGILTKVKTENFQSLSDIVITSYAYHFEEKLHQEHPEAASLLSEGHAYDFKSNVFERLPKVFHANRPDDHFAYIQIFGRLGTERVYRFIRRDYVNRVANLDKWKVLLASVNGSGAFEALSTPLVGHPEVGYTETFMSIGCFETEAEAKACLKYICTKFARAMLGILKATQHNPPPKWKYVPLQDFTPGSDIDWSQPVVGIDRQLYAKYGLTEEEIAFVETHVREME